MEKKQNSKAFCPWVQNANTVAYDPVVMWMETAKQESEGGEHSWREEL